MIPFLDAEGGASLFYMLAFVELHNTLRAAMSRCFNEYSDMDKMLTAYCMKGLRKIHNNMWKLLLIRSSAISTGLVL